MNKKRIIVGSPVYQKPEILEAFLQSLKALRYDGATLDFIFVDDNIEEKSHQLLQGFQRDGSLVTILESQAGAVYVCDEESHHWNDSLMLKVANFKNTIIQYAIDRGYDQLFFIDSDLILHPDLILHLANQQKEIVSEVFWSRWHEKLPLEPNAWLFDEYDLVPKALGEEVSQEEQTIRQAEFLAQLKFPGLYEVGGLGACTLINRSALLKGVSFAPIKNLTIHGEDRFFCIRAAVLGIELYLDTVYPAYHIYREPDLEGVSAYVAKSLQTSLLNRITLSMVVKNEAGRYLEQVLNSLKGHIQEAVIIDDGSSDKTVALCRRLLADIPLHLIKNQESQFANEITLRKQQWEETIKTNPQWILNLDADEMIEEGFWEKGQDILEDNRYNSCEFRLYDMWNPTQYREDAFWNAHNSNKTVLLRYQPHFLYLWHETPQHCGRFPYNSITLSKKQATYKIQHLGWASKEDRENKYKRYQLLDPDAIYGIQEQYDSILDQEPNLVTWVDV